MIRRWHIAIAGIGLSAQMIAAVWHPGYTPVVPERALPLASVAGRVTDDRGQPIAGARVCGLGYGHQIVGDDIEAARCAVSGRDGRYRIIALLPGAYAVSASAGARIPARTSAGTIRVDQGQAATGADIALAPGGVAVRGTVRDMAGRVIGGAQVTVEAFRGSGFAVTHTQDDGTFATWSAPGPILVRAVAPGFAGQWLATRAPDRDVAPRLIPGSIVTGRVVYADRRPVPGARVELHDLHSGIPRPAAISDDDGRFRIERLGPLWYGYDVWVELPHIECWLDLPVHVGLAQTVDDIEIRPASGCSPRQLDWAHERGMVDPDLDAPVPDRNDSVLPRGTKTIVGRVVDSAGQAVAGAYVAAAPDQHWDSSWGQFPPRQTADRAVLTDRAGVFVIAGLLHDRDHNVIVFRPGGGSVMVERDGRGLPDPIVIPAPDRAMIAGTIFGFSDDEPDAFTIAVTDAATGVERREHFYATGGRWAIEDLAPGDYWLAASSRDGDGRGARVRLGPGQGWIGMSIALRPRPPD